MKHKEDCSFKLDILNLASGVKNIEIPKEEYDLVNIIEVTEKHITYHDDWYGPTSLYFNYCPACGISLIEQKSKPNSIDKRIEGLESAIQDTWKDVKENIDYQDIKFHITRMNELRNLTTQLLTLKEFQNENNSNIDTD